MARDTHEDRSISYQKQDSSSGLFVVRINGVFSSIYKTIALSFVIGMLIIFLLGFHFGFGTYYNILSERIHGWQNPTFQEMYDFILNDASNNHTYNTTHICDKISKDVIQNARRVGYRAGYVTLHGIEKNHAIVCFKTSDRGLYFIEPQADVVISYSQLEEMLDLGIYEISNNGGYISAQFERYDINWYKTTEHSKIQFWSN